MANGKHQNAEEKNLKHIASLLQTTVARSLGARCGWRDILDRHIQLCARICGAAVNLFPSELAIADRIETDDPDRDLLVRDALNLELMQLAKFGDLLERQGGVFYQPHRGGLGHQWFDHQLSPTTPQPALNWSARSYRCGRSIPSICGPQQPH